MAENLAADGLRLRHILCSDFINYAPSAVANGATGSDVDTANQNDKAGGINAFVWHWIAPTNFGKDGQPWYSGFYTKATPFNLASALSEGTSGTDYKLLLRDIDAIAVQIKKLQDAGVPILFRPLHEPNGAWFGGVLRARALLNSSRSDWYPGDDLCDIATVDIYATAGNHNPQAAAWSTMYGLTGGTRVLALAEVGVIPDPELQASQDIPWAYWMTWVGDFVSGGSDNSKQFLFDVYSDFHFATVDGATQIGNWKSTT